MARLTDEQWACVRADYEAKGLSYTELESKYGINKSNQKLPHPPGSFFIWGTIWHCNS